MSDGAQLSERARIEAYLKEYAVADCLDEVVNELVTEMPHNPYAHISKFMTSKTLGEILDVRLKFVLLGRGLAGVKATVSTNLTTFHASAPVNRYMDALGGDAIVDFQLVESKARDALKGLRPDDLQGNDAAILECQLMTPPVALALSMACARAGARHSDKELYRFLAEQIAVQPRVPAPVVTVVGRAAGGSIAVTQGVTVIPTTPSFFENAMETVIAASRAVTAKLDELKTPGTVPDLGCPVVHAADTQLGELLEMVDSVLAAEGVEGAPKLGLDYRACELALPLPPNEEGEEPTDDVARAYLLSGAEVEEAPLTGADIVTELVPLWRQSAIITLEDPLCLNDTALETFNDMFDESILDIRNTMSADCAYNMKGVAGDSNVQLQLLCDSSVSSIADVGRVRYPFNTVKVTLADGGGSVYAALQMAKAIRDANHTLVVGVPRGGPDSSDDFLADFAVGCGASQYFGGGLGASEYNAKYSRLVDIAASDETLKYVGKAFR